MARDANIVTNTLWQVQVRKDGDVLWFQQNDGAISSDALRPAVENAKAWAREHGADNGTLFVTVDPNEFVMVGHDGCA